MCQNICYHVAAFVISFNWYATWQCSAKVKFWPFDPTPRVEGAKYLLPHCCIRDSIQFDMRAKYLHICCCIHDLICNMTMFWKNWILTFWPQPLNFMDDLHFGTWPYICFAGNIKSTKCIQVTVYWPTWMSQREGKNNVYKLVCGRMGLKFTAPLLHSISKMTNLTR